MKLTVKDLNSFYGPAHILFDIAHQTRHVAGSATPCSGMQRPAVGCKGRFVHHFRQGWVRMDDAGDVL